MKYEINQDVIIRKGKLTGYRGWIAENDNQRMARLGMPYEIIFYDNCPVHNEWMPEEYLMSTGELVALQAENERLKVALRQIASIRPAITSDVSVEIRKLQSYIDIAKAALAESEQPS